ncbi:MarR family transcriptional regulator [Streptococcus danieliae]|nr:MarR family transcriptional regulator [Streptococcus danieliae]
MSFRNTNENYTSVNNAFSRDKALEPATIGILFVILSNDPHWTVYPEEIATRLGISRTTVDRHFKILEKAGYMRTLRFNLKNRGGSIVRRLFSDIPITDVFFEYWKSRVEKEVLDDTN